MEFHSSGGRCVWQSRECIWSKIHADLLACDGVPHVLPEDAVCFATIDKQNVHKCGVVQVNALECCVLRCLGSLFLCVDVDGKMYVFGAPVHLHSRQCACSSMFSNYASMRCPKAFPFFVFMWHRARLGSDVPSWECVAQLLKRNNVNHVLQGASWFYQCQLWGMELREERMDSVSLEVWSWENGNWQRRTASVSSRTVTEIRPN